MARTARLLAAAAVFLFGLPARANDLVTFSAGSLIIPMQGNYQNECGTASAYGLVWRILQSNQPGHFNGPHPVTVYWAIYDNKASPNRCVPSNLHTNPSGGAWDSNPAWNDGCDLSITNSDHEPVVPVDYAATWPASNNGIYEYGQIPMFNSAMYPSVPDYPDRNLNEGTNPKFTTIQYLGGPFIIAKKDAENVIAFLKSGDTYTPVGTGSTGPLSRFTTPCTCRFNLDLAGQDTRCNYVNMHQATIGFDAYIGRRMRNVPPKIALLAGSDNANASSAIWADPVTFKIFTTILDQYLKNAGLWVTGTGAAHQDSGGCPLGSHSACTLNGSIAGGTKNPGLIYDSFWANSDLISTEENPYGLLNAPDPSDPTGQTPLYRVFWTPHWAGFDTDNKDYYKYYNSGSPDPSELKNALENVAHFADRPHTGLMAECASLESYEGSLNHTNPDITTPTSATHFQFSKGIEANGITPNDLSAAFNGRNCTDPNYDHLGPCMFYPYPGSPFAQIGDFRFDGRLGHVQQYRPNTAAGSVKNPGLSELAISWVGAKGDRDYENKPPGENDGWDFFSVSQKDNDPNKAMILYLAGHDYGSSLAGNRVVLNTLLNLGADPTGSERALVAPIAFNDPSDKNASGKPTPKVIQGSYLAVSDYPDGVEKFSPSTGARWVFPYIPGHLRAHLLEGSDGLTEGANKLDAAVLWDADDSTLMPAPVDRNLFTYFGGTVGAVASDRSFGSFGATTLHPVLQTGWKPQSISHGNLTPSTCVDELRYGYTGPTTSRVFGLAPGSDGICDLQQALEFTPVKQTDTDAVRKSRLDADLDNVKRMLQRVRGFCWATTRDGMPIMEPTDAQCDPGATVLAGEKLNRAHLGGIVHSTPVVVGGSAFESGRPTVAYFGGYDGQLHAVYVSGGSGYVGRKFAPNGNLNAWDIFKKPWDFTGTLPKPGTELWAFIPPSQLPLLQTNGARLDSAPMVEDVFVDLDGSGLRSWHTILVMSVGATGREVFAMDVTNPLKPVLLWDVAGSRLERGPDFSANLLANKNLTDASGKLLDRGGSATTIPTRFSHKWVSGTTRYDYQTAGDQSDLFDYSDLGGASGVTFAQLRRGIDPVYAAIVTTNASGANATKRAVEVFAIDIASGQKLWQWERPYQSSSLADNAVPPVSSVFNYSPDTPRIYVPDQEGRLWELDANTGRNVNYHDDKTFVIEGCKSAPCELALLDTSLSSTPQPLTTNVAVVRVPDKVNDGSVFQKYTGARLLLVGTAGADWVSSSVAGRIYALLLDEGYRKPIREGGTTLNGSPWLRSDALRDAQDYGLLQSPAGFPHSLAAGEHLYGAISAVGQRIFFESAAPNSSINDPMQLVKLSESIAGSTYVINEASATTGDLTAAIFSNANFGGTAVLVGTDAVYTIAAEVNDIAVQKVEIPTLGPKPPEAPTASLKPDLSLPYRLANWLRRTFR
jgi:type IV pilus assembly protein PilY1